MKTKAVDRELRQDVSELLVRYALQAESLEDFMVLGHIMTALPAVNAIPGVVAAPPGIVSYPDLPVPCPRGFVPL